MRFGADDSPRRGSSESSELSDAVTQEHPKHVMAVAEERIREMHSHRDGSPIELHQVGSQEFIQQSIRNSLEGKIGDVSSDFGNEGTAAPLSTLGGGIGGSESNKNNLAAAKIEYERKSQNQAGQQAIYGAQQSVTGAGAAARHETAMVGCNCGAEWTVTGQSTKTDPANPAGGVKIEQYGPGGAGSAGQPGGYRASGAGGEKQEYRASAGQHQDYKG